jgi:hypothetical protein
VGGDDRLVSDLYQAVVGAVEPRFRGDVDRTTVDLHSMFFQARNQVRHVYTLGQQWGERPHHPKPELSPNAISDAAARAIVDQCSALGLTHI